MEMDERREREEWFKQSLRIEHGPTGEWRYVTLFGLALGRLKQNDDGQYELEYRDGWVRYPTVSGAADFELAEGWAVEGVASMMAMDEQARRLHG